MNDHMEGRTAEYCVAPKMSREVRRTTSVKRRHDMKKKSKKQLKRSAKTILHEYEMKSHVTWEFADVFCDASNWHASLKGEEAERQRIKLEPPMTKTETVDETPVNEPLMEITSTGDDQQSRRAGMIEDEPFGSAFNDTVTTHSTAPVYKVSVNVRNDVSVNLAASADESFAAPPNDICSEETFDKTSEKSRYPRYRRFLKRTSLNDEIIRQPVPNDNTEIEATEADIKELSHAPEMFEHQELYTGANNNTDGVKTDSNRKQHTNTVQATNPKHHNQTKKKQFRCSDCQKEFEWKSKLIVHNRIHSGEKPFKCTRCPQVFSQKSHLTTHQRIHSGERPFKCTKCQEVFSQKSTLTRHQRIHSGGNH